jgi:lipopolysaccharide export system ATP-binding protein
MSNIKKFRIKSFKDKSALLKLEKLSLKFGKKIILDNLNLQLNNGQILGLLGPNGVGKSTIFNLITGLLFPDFGSIIIKGMKKLTNILFMKEQLNTKLALCHKMEDFSII